MINNCKKLCTNEYRGLNIIYIILGENEMRKIISISLILFLAISISACGNKENNERGKDSKIEVASLTEEESNVLKLFGVGGDSKIFDYIVDEKVKSMHVKQYTLDKNLEWQEQGGSLGQIKDLKGRIAISINENWSLRIAFQDKNGVTSWNSNSELSKNISNNARSTSWANSSDIVYEQEIPLAIQIITKSNSIRTFGVESFFDTQRLKGHDTVIAVTITFSQDELE
jgi:hypothetical protein